MQMHLQTDKDEEVHKDSQSKQKQQQQQQQQQSQSSTIITEATIYRDAASVHDASFIEYESMLLSKLNWTSQDKIKIVRYIDSGRFSSVFEARMKVEKKNETEKDNGENVAGNVDESNVAEGREGGKEGGAQEEEMPVVLKILKPTFLGKIKREIKILELLREAKGVIRLLGVAKNSGCQTVTLIFESLGANAQWLSHTAAPLSAHQIELLVYKLLQALEECHARGVMHRDVKPRNVICRRRTGDLRLIDFNLSEFYLPGKEYNPNVASRHYKGPELLCGYLYYDYAVDIWSAGCLLAGLIFETEPFFYGSDSLDQISCIAAVVGSQEILDWLKKYKLKTSPEIQKAIGACERVPWDEFRTEQNSHLCTPLAVDLVSKMLVVDHQRRLTVRQCLEHPYFDRVRKLLQQEATEAGQPTSATRSTSNGGSGETNQGENVQ